MMTEIDTLMVLLFPFLDAIPFGLPRYWICRDRLRIPFRYVVLLLLTLSTINSAAFYYINQGGPQAAAQWTTIIRYTFMLLYLALAFLLVKDSFPKLMFTWLLIMGWQFFVLGNANFIESRFFWDFSDLHPYLVYNIARVTIYLITCPFMLHFFTHTISNALKIDDAKMWRHFWKIPLFSMLFGMLYCTVTDVYAYATWQFFVSRYLMLFGVCYVSYVALKVLESSRSQAQMEGALRYADQNLLAQKKQYDTLAAHMEDTRRARHDLRQHLTVMQSYLEKDDKTGLSEYLAIYRGQLLPDTLELYSRNDVVNAIVCYYAALAREDKVSFEVKIDYPEDCPVSAMDITVLLGNLLENAVEACRHEAEPKLIKLWVGRKGNVLLVLVDNTCTARIRFQDDMPLSSKREGRVTGIGTASVRSIAERYGGTTQFEQRNGMFYTSVLLHITDNNAAQASLSCR